MTYVSQNVDKDMPSGMFFVLFRLADRGGDHRHDDWTCFPSIETQCEDTHLSRSAVERHLQALVMEGWISRKRRVRKDGTLGIYDYWIHRDAARRAALKAARAAIKEAGGKLTEGLADLDDPCGETPHGPCGETGASMRQNGAQPCGDLPQQEPSVNPQENPHTERAREPSADQVEAGFQRFMAAYPASGLEKTDWRPARAAFGETIAEAAAASAACGEGDGIETLVACAANYARSGSLAKGDHGAVNAAAFLTRGRWRSFLPGSAAAQAVAQAAAAPPRFADAAVRSALVRMLGGQGEAFAASCLDPAEWDGEARVITPRTGWAGRRLREEARALWVELNITIGERNG